MARLVWDEDGLRTYETGTKMGVVYPWDQTKNGGKGGYSQGYAWNGLSAVSITPSGADETAIYADDIKYLSLRSREEIGGTIEAYGCPKEFEKCDGTASIGGDYSGVVIGQQTRQRFGFVFVSTKGNDTEGNDHGYKIHILYGCTASPSEKSYQTINDSPEAITFSWEFTTLPTNVPGFKPTSYICIDSKTCDATKLSQIEDLLFGTDGQDAIEADSTANPPIEAQDAVPATPPTLPSPAEIIEILSAQG